MLYLLPIRLIRNLTKEDMKKLSHEKIIYLIFNNESLKY